MLFSFNSKNSEKTFPIWGAIPKPILKPPFIMNSDGKSGCLPKTGALERERGRTFAQVQIGSLPVSSGNMFEAFKIKSFKLLSLVSSC